MKSKFLHLSSRQQVLTIRFSFSLIVALVSLPASGATVVSNLGGTGSAGLGGTGFGYGRSFTTGTSTYRVDSISISLSDFFAGNSAVSVQLWSDSGGSGPGSLLENLGVVSTSSTSFATLTANSSSNPTLAANTRYWIVVMYDTGVPRVPAQSNTATGDSGSTIQNDLWTTSNSGSTWTASPEFDGSVSFAVSADSLASVSSITRVSTSSVQSGSRQWTVTFSEAVTGLGTANFSLSAGGAVSGTSISSVSGSGTTYTVTANAGSGEGTLTLNFANDTGLTPLVSNEPFAGESYTIDNTSPTLLVSAPSTASVTGNGTTDVTYTITYADNVGVNAITLASGNVTLNKTGTADGTATVSGTGTSTRTVTISSISGNGTLGITIAAGTAGDVAGNTAAAAGPSTTFAVVAPEIVLHDGATTSDAAIANNAAAASMGTTALGTPITKTYNIENTGTTTLNVSLSTMPSGFSLSGAFPSAIAPGASSTFTVQLDAVAAGNHSGNIVIATDDGDDNPFTFTVSGAVNKDTPTVAVISDSNDPSVVGEAYTVEVEVSGANATPTGTVTVSDGTSALVTFTLSGGIGSGQLTSTSAGTKTLTATYNGDANHNSASDSSETHTVNKRTPTITITSDASDPSVVGQAYTVAVSVTGNATTPTGTVTLSDGSGANATITLAGGTGSTSLTSTTAGAKTLSATYNGDSSYETGTDTESHTVNKGTPTVTITSDTNDPSGVGEAYTVQVTVSGAGATPTGTVTVDDGEGNQSIITLSGGSGSGTVTTSSTGNKTLTATYSGDVNYNSATDTEPHTVEAVVVTNLGGSGELGLAATGQGWSRAFTIGNTAYIMDSITLALASLSGTSQVTVQLWTDDGANGPGSLIESLGVVSSTSTTFANTTLASATRPILAKNTKYWVVALYSSGQPRLRLTEGTITGSDGATVNPGVFFTESSGASWADAGIGIENAVSFAVRGTAVTTISGITRAGSEFSNHSSVQWTITFSDAVSGLNTGNFSLSTSGTLTGTSVTGVSGSGATWTVTANTGTGDGTLGLTLANDTGLTPLLSNGPFAGETYIIDKTAPTVSISTPSPTSVLGGSGTDVTYTLTYADNQGVTAVTLANGNVTLNSTGTAAGTATVSGSGTITRTVTISSISGLGSLGISLAAGTATDAAGNVAAVAGPSSTLVVIAPEIVVHDGASTSDPSVANNGAAASMGTTTVGTPLTKTYTIQNTGTSTLNVSLTSVPANFTLSGVFPSAIAAGTSANFNLQMAASATGNNAGNVVIATDDQDENPFAFGVSGTVNQATPIVTINSDASDPSAVGQPYTVQVTVTGSVTPTGTVAVSDGDGNNASITLTNGSGSTSLTSTMAGVKTLTALYSGDSNYLTASDTEAHTVTQTTPTVTITSDTNDPSDVGEAYTVVVSVTGPGITPTGTVAVNDGTGASTAISLTNGIGSGTITSTTAGNKTLTASYTGDGNYLAATDTEAHTVNKATPTVTITSDSPDASIVGQAYTVQVSVTGPVTPTGSVTVNDGEGNQATITLSGGSGSATLTTGTAGLKNLTANYSGDSNLLSGSDTESHTVSPGTPTVTITSDQPDQSAVGINYTVGVTVSGGGATPTGTVTVSDGVGNNTSITLTNGSGTGSISSSTAGTLTLSATYPGDTNYTGGIDTEQHTVSKGIPTVTITSDANDPSPVGQAYTVQVSVTGAGATPTGTVTLTDSLGANATIILSGGTGSTTLTTTNAGSRILSANYGGDSNYLTGFDTEVHTVSRGNSTVTITGASPNPTDLGGTYAVTVSVVGAGAAPTGFVTVTDGSGSQSVAVLTNGTTTAVLTASTAGTKTLTASYSGDTNYESGSDSQAHAVNKGTPTINITSDGPDPSVLATGYNVAVTVTGPGAAPTGTVTLTDGEGGQAIITLVNGTGSATLTGTTAGVKTLTASYAGDANYNPAADTEQHTVAKATTSLVITSDTPDPTVVGEAYSVTVSVTGNGGTPSGTVQITDGTGATNTITLSNGAGTGTLTSATAGGKVLTAIYSGDANFSTATTTAAHTVNRGTPVLTIVSDTPDPSIAGQPYAVQVSVTGSGVTPTGLVTISDGAGGFGSVTLSGGTGTAQMTSHTVGQKTLSARYSGDLNYDAATNSATHDVQFSLVSNLGGTDDLPIIGTGLACSRSFRIGQFARVLKSITVSLRSQAGSSGVSVQLWSARQSAPGTLIENLGTLNTTNTAFTELTISSIKRPILSAGATYWLVLLHASGQPAAPLNATTPITSEGAVLGSGVLGSIDAGATWVNRTSAPNGLAFAINADPLGGPASITSITRNAAANTSASTVTWTVLFNQSVSGLSSNNFALPVSGAVAGAAITGVTGSTDTWTVTANTGSGDGTLGLNLVNDSFVLPGLSNEPFTGETYNITRQIVPVFRVNAIDTVGGLPRLRVGNQDGSPVTAAQLTDLQVYATSDVSASGWTLLTNAIVLIGNEAQIVDPDAGNGIRFYRFARPQ